jgi:hypothetical protein
MMAANMPSSSGKVVVARSKTRPGHHRGPADVAGGHVQQTLHQSPAGLRQHPPVLDRQLR